VKAALIAALALALAGCTLGDDRVTRSCDRSSDCFQAQGEICNLDTNQCEQRPDAGSPAMLENELDDEEQTTAPEEASHAE